MKTRKKTAFSFLALLAAIVLPGVRDVRAELIWTGVNQADADTLALYHFNEGSGTSATDASANGRNATLTSDFYASEGSSSWLNSGAGTYLSGTSGTPGDYVNTIAVTGVDWDKGLTISLWYRVRDEVGSPNGNQLFYLDGPATAPRVYLSTDTFGTGNNGRLNFTDTQGPGADLSTGNTSFGTNHVWRHVAAVYNPGGNSADGGSWAMYLDNVQAGITINVSQDLSAASSFNIRFMSGLFSSAGMSADFDEVLVQNGVITDFSDAYNVVPEPASALLMGVGICLMALKRKRRA